MRGKLARQFEVEKSKIHAHHIVRKKVPAEYTKKIGDKLVKDFDAPGVDWDDACKRAWYIGKSQEILENAGVSVLADSKKAMAAAKRGEPLENLCLAINGEGTHTVATQKAVYDMLKNETTEAGVKRALADLKEMFQSGLLIAGS